MRRWRETTDLASVVAAPFWLLTWLLTAGRFGKPLYRVEVVRNPRRKRPPRPKPQTLAAAGGGGGGVIYCLTDTAHTFSGAVVGSPDLARQSYPPGPVMLTVKDAEETLVFHLGPHQIDGLEPGEYAVLMCGPGGVSARRRDKKPPAGIDRELLVLVTAVQHGPPIGEVVRVEIETELIGEISDATRCCATDLIEVFDIGDEVGRFRRCSVCGTRYLPRHLTLRNTVTDDYRPCVRLLLPPDPPPNLLVSSCGDVRPVRDEE